MTEEQRDKEVSTKLKRIREGNRKWLEKLKNESK